MPWHNNFLSHLMQIGGMWLLTVNGMGLFIALADSNDGIINFYTSVIWNHARVSIDKIIILLIFRNIEYDGLHLLISSGCIRPICGLRVADGISIPTFTPSGRAMARLHRLLFHGPSRRFDLLDLYWSWLQGNPHSYFNFKYGFYKFVKQYIF